MPKHDQPKLKKVSVNLPFGIGGTEWEADATERRAAWSLFVELVTRVTIQPLEPRTFTRSAGITTQLVCNYTRNS
jgi:hypothetical protein